MADRVVVPRHLPNDGRALHSVKGAVTVATFRATVNGGHIKAGGDMTLSLNVESVEIPSLVTLLQQTGGIEFTVTVVRIPVDYAAGL